MLCSKVKLIIFFCFKLKVDLEAFFCELGSVVLRATGAIFDDNAVDFELIPCCAGIDIAKSDVVDFN